MQVVAYHFFRSKNLFMLKAGLGILLCILLTGCWELDVGPRPGLWYKHKITGKEIKIEGMGWGRELYQACSTVVNTTGTFKRQLMGYDATQIIYNPAYDNRVCVVYEIEGDYEKKEPSYFCIVPEKEIWTNYQRTTRRD